jgi:polysaccharide biosynthesis transport protein
VIRQNQLSNGSGLAEYDPFGAPMAAPQQPDDSPMQLLFKMHRLLRGRYVLALVLAAIGALVGAAAGYFSTGPKWQSIGVIRVEPMGKVILGPTETTFTPMFDSYVREQIAYLEEDETVRRTMLSDEWRKFGRGVDAGAKKDFRKSLNINVDRDNRGWIKVRFVDSVPEAAQVAVQKLIDSYKVIFGDKILLSNKDSIAVLERARLKYEGELKGMDSRIAKLGEKFGTTDLAQLHADAFRDRGLAEKKLEELDAQIDHAKALAAAAKNNTGPSRPEPPAEVRVQEEAIEIARVDTLMSQLLQSREAALTDLQRARRTYVPNSPQVQKAEAEVADWGDRVKARHNQWMLTHNNMLPAVAGAGGGPVLTAPIEVLEANRKTYQELYNKKDALAISIHQAKREIDQIQAEIKNKNEELLKVRERLNLLSLDSAVQPVDSSAIGRVQIVNDGQEPSLYSDSRKKLAALGFLMGGSLPIIAIMLLGSLDGRFRYSDDAQAGAGSGRVPLLGILPFLPDTINDPEQAGIAAHCVHQIRTLLQIGGVEHDRRVFAITSATSGDGKTSLSVSLGLSFAASGSNTCLIDFDMIGGGLTVAMGARSDVGLLAAIDDGQLDGHVRPTAFPRLSIIPAGRDDAQEISRLSPKLVRRIIDQARKQFDVVIIDTGPILGSIEATLVCGVADGVVLALGRGQQRSMAKRAIDTLHGVGAHIMGVVFNRAQANDFRRTVSQSVRSIPVHDSDGSVAMKALPAIGPMARTVVSHTRSDS